MEKSKELTPMQELMEWNNSRDKFSQLTWIELDAKLKELLPKEKQGYEEKIYHCLGYFAQKHNIIIDGNELDEWLKKH